jgi:hypothetical protein
MELRDYVIDIDDGENDYVLSESCNILTVIIQIDSTPRWGYLWLLDTEFYRSPTPTYKIKCDLIHNSNSTFAERVSYQELTLVQMISKLQETVNQNVLHVINCIKVGWSCILLYVDDTNNYIVYREAISTIPVMFIYLYNIFEYSKEFQTEFINAIINVTMLYFQVDKIPLLYGEVSPSRVIGMFIKDSNGIKLDIYNNEIDNIELYNTGDFDKNDPRFLNID